MIATALCLTERQIDEMGWEHYKALAAHWQDNPPAHVTLGAWLRAVSR